MIRIKPSQRNCVTLQYQLTCMVCITILYVLFVDGIKNSSKNITLKRRCMMYICYFNLVNIFPNAL